MFSFSLLKILIIYSSWCVVIGRNNNYCNNRGYYNTSDGLCNCFNSYHGVSCGLKYCPFGPSWWSPPIANDRRNRVKVPCSNMGSCNDITGECVCRPGYEGAACERLSCPTNLKYTTFNAISRNGSYGLGRSAPFSSIPLDATVTTYSNTPVLPCSGHGRCLTMREAGHEFNGLSLVRPPTPYTLWDADAIQGCICDNGWSGYDCSQRKCLDGPDTSQTSSYSLASGSYSYEIYTIQCQASEGYFGIRIAGEETGPIPYDADIGYLKEILLRLNHISSVRIVMESEGVPRICGESSVLSTTLRLTDRVGPRPPIYVSSSLTAPSKRFGANSAQKLSLYGGAGTAILRMATTYTLTCAVCASCTNYNLVFQFGKNISASVPVISATATTISTAISGISDFATSATNIWTNFDISVAFSTATTTLCDASATSTSAITLYSDYGNIPGLEIIDNTGGLITLTADGEGAGGSGIGECSHNGVCDTETGLCSCIQSKIDNPSGGNANEYYYKASNSDGSGTNTAGTRNDCSYIEVENSMCWEQHSRDSVSNMAYTPSCQGRGYCLNSTGACECYKGFRGINCGVIDCPKGPAWFDEPLSATNAHNPATCSNRGLCDTSTGVCKCMDGFSGPACERKDCPGFDVTTGGFCKGNGYCMNVREMTELYGFSYGEESDGTVTIPASRTESAATTTTPETWDANNWYECVCANSAALLNQDVMGHVKYPSVGPGGYISGIPVESRPLPGFTGWDCSDYMCPFGSNPHHKRYNSDAATGFMISQGGDQLERQRVRCQLSGDSSLGFHLQFFGRTTEYSTLQSKLITIDMKEKEIREAIEGGVHGLWNVSISFPLSDSDGILTACDSSTSIHRGYWEITFESEVGDIPAMSVVEDSYNGGLVQIMEVVKGNKMRRECSGETGYCDRTTGTCICDPLNSYVSSNGSDTWPGSRGDCGAKMTY